MPSFGTFSDTNKIENYNNNFNNNNRKAGRQLVPMINLGADLQPCLIAGLKFSYKFISS